MDELELYIKKHQENKIKSQDFVEHLYYLMDKNNITNSSDIYNKVFISRQLWSSIISKKSQPSLLVCVKIALALKLSNSECKLLLKKAGYTLASSNRFALIIRYALDNKIYDIVEVNNLLISHGCEEFKLL